MFLFKRGTNIPYLGAFHSFDLTYQFYATKNVNFDGSECFLLFFRCFFLTIHLLFLVDYLVNFVGELFLIDVLAYSADRLSYARSSQPESESSYH
jgi:hypothetical protein